jgi:hypothetical protein
MKVQIRGGSAENDQYWIEAIENSKTKQFQIEENEKDPRRVYVCPFYLEYMYVHSI